VGRIRDWSGVHIDAVKSGINLIARAHFGMVFVRRDHLILDIILDHELKHPHAKKVEQLSPQLFIHKFWLTSTEDVNDELIGWVRDAYELKR
jgi:hypothetical protein